MTCRKIWCYLTPWVSPHWSPLSLDPNKSILLWNSPRTYIKKRNPRSHKFLHTWPVRFFIFVPKQRKSSPKPRTNVSGPIRWTFWTLNSHPLLPKSSSWCQSRTPPVAMPWLVFWRRPRFTKGHQKKQNQAVGSCVFVFGWWMLMGWYWI